MAAIDPVLRIQQALTVRDHTILAWLYDIGRGTSTPAFTVTSGGTSAPSIGDGHDSRDLACCGRTRPWNR
jgi:hypothetical protein